MTGLSPRVRGNLVTPSSAVTMMGSIPACVGEPRGVSVVGDIQGVYPRVCGGTVSAALPTACD